MYDKKLGIREVLGIFLLLLGTKLSDMSPSLLAYHGKNAFWLIAVISFIIIIPVYFILLHMLTKLKDKNLVESMFFLLGKHLGFLVGFIFFLLALLLTIIDSRTYIDEINIIYLEESPITVLYFIFIGVCVFGASRGIETIGYTAWAIFPYIKLALLMLFFLSLKEVIWLRIFPIFGEGLGVLVTEGIKKASLFGGNMILFLIAFTSIKDAKDLKKASLISYCVGVTEITFFYIIYGTIFDYKSIDKVAFPFHELTSFVSVGVFFTNVETFFFGFWLIAGSIRFIVYLYITAWFFAELFSIKNIKSLLPIFGFMIIAIGIMPENSSKVLLIYRENILFALSIACMFLPFVMYLGGKIKGVF